MPIEKKYPLVWDLDSLYPRPESPEFKLLLDDYKARLKQLADDSESLPPVGPESAGAWATFLERVEQVFSLSSDLGAFVGCHGAADTSNKIVMQIEAQLAAAGPDRSRVFTNIELAFRSISDDELKTFAAADDRLHRIEFFLEDCRANARLRMAKDQELLASELDVDGLHAWGRLYDRISGDLRVDLMEKGELVKKSTGQVRLDVADRKTRENNFFALEKAWKTVADTCADALNHISGTRLTKYRRLGLKDHLEAPLRYNRMRRETLDVMWSTIAARKPILNKFFQRKAELLGIDRMAWYDQLAPLPQAGSGSDTLTYDQACDTIIEAFTEFSGDLGDFARMSLSGGWVEAEDRSGKRQGGFCTGLPVKRQSRIFMTFTGSADSMSTLAHELGHAYHSHVLRSQPYLLQDYPMNLAETASTFAEAVLGEKRLAHAKDPRQRLAILNNMVADAMVFMCNIHSRFLFEDRFHRERAQGELTAARLTELMLEAQKEGYMDAFSEWTSVFWVSKLHFYISGLPFYNFPYTFGYLLSLGVYSTAGDFGDNFPEKYRELLINTGCMNAEEAVKSTLGYDLSKPDFWNRSLDIIEQRVNEFVKVSDELL